MAISSEDVKIIESIIYPIVKPMRDDISGIKEEQSIMNARLDKMDERLDKMDERLDKMDARIGKLESAIEDLSVAVHELHNTVVRMETELFSKINAAMDGVVGSADKNDRQDKKIYVMGRTLKKHDERLFVLEQSAKKA
jgi:predicted RNase H-like nuclease (RuvC/YqgF family)